MNKKISKINSLIKKKYKYELLENGFSSKDIAAGRKVLNSKRITMAENTRKFEDAFRKKNWFKICINGKFRIFSKFISCFRCRKIF